MKQTLLALTLALTSTLAQPAPNDYWKFELLHSFDAGPGGHYPLAGLVEVGKGIFWGTALAGEEDHGTVFKFSLAGGLTVKHAFKGNDGHQPAAGLLLIGEFLYGTTEVGGAADRGTVFRVSKSGDFTLLNSLDTTSGHGPEASLVQGPDGKLYGTAMHGSADGLGSVFRTDDAGALEVVHAFSDLRGGGTDGWFSKAPLVLHPNGNFYGTTLAGGLWGEGSLFKLSPAGDFTLLHSFLGGNNAVGCKPQAGLTLAADGGMVGVNSFCGSMGAGTLFKLTPEGAVSLLHTLSPRSHGSKPMGGLALRSDGRFYGTASKGAWGCGSVFSKSASPRGSFKRLHAFAADGSDGCDPRGSLIVGKDGALYGTTTYGGANGSGTIFRLRHIVNYPPQ
jgi:uncharacterized repeat protein (TIGR03803 family)